MPRGAHENAAGRRSAPCRPRRCAVGPAAHARSVVHKGEQHACSLSFSPTAAPLRPRRRQRHPADCRPRPACPRAGGAHGSFLALKLLSVRLSPRAPPVSRPSRPARRSARTDGRRREAVVQVRRRPRKAPRAPVGGPKEDFPAFPSKTVCADCKNFNHRAYVRCPVPFGAMIGPLSGERGADPPMQTRHIAGDGRTTWSKASCPIINKCTMP